MDLWNHGSVLPGEWTPYCLAWGAYPPRAPRYSSILQREAR
jgi:hypothetical protein